LTDASDKLDIFLRHRADLIDYAAPIVGCRARAEDVVQEAWLRFAAAQFPAGAQRDEPARQGICLGLRLLVLLRQPAGDHRHAG
jgi:hypothetical protein